jgi:hypothetical protein
VIFVILILFDLVTIDRQYVNNDNFKPARYVDTPYQSSEADKEILKDKEHFRVLDVSRIGQSQPARAAYFHNSLFGYHAAKLGRYNELMEFHIYKNNVNVLNMLNTKYIIDQDEQGRPVPVTYYTQPNGNAWFVNELRSLASANEEIMALDSINTKTVAVTTALELRERINILKYETDSLATIALKSFKPNYLKYEASNENNGFVMFSEIYYKHGWNAYLDGNLVPHYRVNYVLRGMEVPRGNHIIEFKFEPEVVETGSSIAFASSAILGLLFLLGIFHVFKQRKAEA